MNPMIFGAIVGVPAFAIGCVIGILVTRKRWRKKMNDILEQDATEMSKLKIERDQLKHRASLVPDAEWSEIQKEVEKGRKQVANETEPENDILDKTEDLAKRKEDRMNYQAICTKYIADPEASEDDPSHGIIRKTAANGIYEIDEMEYRESKEFPLEDLYFHEMSTDLYTDDETLIDSMEVPSYLGYSTEQLAVRFLYDDEPSYIYVRNPDHKKIYCVYIAQGVGPQ